LAALARAVRALAQVIWINPAATEEGAVEWLEMGAPVERNRRLNAH